MRLDTNLRYDSIPTEGQAGQQRPSIQEITSRRLLVIPSVLFLFVVTYAMIAPSDVVQHQVAATVFSKDPAPVDPFSTVSPPSLGFQQVPRSNQSFAPGSSFASLPEGPLPTNAWWMNAVLGSGTGLDNLLNVEPYLIIPAATGVQIFYPKPTMIAPNTFGDIFDKFYSFINLFPQELAERPVSHSVVSYDDMGVTLRWVAADGSGSMDAILVRGSPWVTLSINQLTPQFLAAHVAEKMLADQQPLDCTLPVNVQAHTVQWSLRFLGQTWKVWADSPLDVLCANGMESTPTAYTLTSRARWTGTLRLALISAAPFPSAGTPVGSTAASTTIPATAALVPDLLLYGMLLDAHVGTIVTGANVRYSVNNGEAEIVYEWVTDQFLIEKTSTAFASRLSTIRGIHPSFPVSSAGSAPPPLVLALPRHIALFADSTTQGVVRGVGGHYNFRGLNLPVIAADGTWHLKLSVPDLNTPKIRPDLVAELEHELEAQSTRSLPSLQQLGLGDPLTAGKHLHRLARIVFIAQDICDNDACLQSVRGVVGELRDALSLWLNGQGGSQLVYDPSWRGLVSCGCDVNDCNGNCSVHCQNIRTVDIAGMHKQAARSPYPLPPSTPLSQDVCFSLKDGGADFGNGLYNDHHIHYGYFIYAAAAVGAVDPDWAKEYRERVLVLIRDIANPSRQDPFFPRFRHMDWYYLHSWSNGIASPRLQGRNQQSVSEAAHAWYAVALWGSKTGNAEITEVGSVLLAAEVSAAHHYWQVDQNSVFTPFAQLQQQQLQQLQQGIPAEQQPGGPSVAPTQARSAVGIVWSTMAQITTWWSDSAWSVLGAQTVPLTPLTSSLLPQKWAENSLPVFNFTCFRDDNCWKAGWLAHLLALQAIADQSGQGAPLVAIPTPAPPLALGNQNQNQNQTASTQPVPKTPGQAAVAAWQQVGALPDHQFEAMLDSKLNTLHFIAMQLTPK